MKAVCFNNNRSSPLCTYILTTSCSLHSLLIASPVAIHMGLLGWDQPITLVFVSAPRLPPIRNVPDLQVTVLSRSIDTTMPSRRGVGHGLHPRSCRKLGSRLAAPIPYRGFVRIDLSWMILRRLPFPPPLRRAISVMRCRMAAFSRGHQYP